jgi:4-hydroxybenzoate polyprenyltransferase
MTHAPSSPSPIAHWSRSLGLIAADIKLAHSIFALPFAILGAGLAGFGRLDARSVAIALALVVVCMVLARTWAMLINRLVDRGFDAENVRTKRRVFAVGTLSPGMGWALSWACAALFIASTAGFWLALENPWPLWLSAPVLGWIAFYSLTKRFTWLCHVFLGGALAASPLAAAIALRPESLADTPSILWLAGMVLAWVAGFDIIYALQDVSFDRQRGLSSIPASLGVPRALWISRSLHFAAAGALFVAWRSEPRFGVAFGLAVVLVCGLLIAEHVVLARKGERGLDMAFFTLNGIVSCVVGVAGVLDLTLV